MGRHENLFLPVARLSHLCEQDALGIRYKSKWYQLYV